MVSNLIYSAVYAFIHNELSENVTITIKFCVSTQLELRFFFELIIVIEAANDLGHKMLVGQMICNGDLTRWIKLVWITIKEETVYPFCLYNFVVSQAKIVEDKSSAPQQLALHGFPQNVKWRKLNTLPTFPIFLSPRLDELLRS